MIGKNGYNLNRRKIKVIGCGCCMKVTGIVTNSVSLSLSKKEKSKIRAAVHECENMAKVNLYSKNYVSLYRSTLGRVYWLKQLDAELGAEYEKREAINNSV